MTATTPTQPRGDELELLSIDGLRAGYGPVQVLFDIDMTIRSDEIVAIVGANGAGKSTLLAAITGIVSPTGGTLRYRGREVDHWRPVEAAREGVALVAGGSTTFPTLTVAEHFKMATWPGVNRVDSHENDIEGVLDKFPRLRERWSNRGGDLSGGEQQQLALALAFLTRPSLLMIDELSLGLAPIIVSQLLEDVRELHRLGSAIIVVEQSVDTALALADRAYVMEKGQIQLSGSAAELREHPEIVRQKVFHLGVPDRSEEGDEATAAAADLPALGRTILTVSDLSRRFGGVLAVHDVSFEAAFGEVVGFIGPNGAGKTTVFDLVSGFLDPTSGRVTLDGVDVTDRPPHRRVAAGIGRSFQDSRVFPNLTVGANLALGLDRHLDHRDLFASFLNLPAVQEAEARLRPQVDALLERFGLISQRDVPASDLPTGTRRLLDLAMVVALEPLVVMLDEPSSGVAQHDTGRIEAAIEDLRATGDCAVLVIEHDMGLLARVSDRLIAMDQGTIVMQGPPSDVLTDSRIVASYLGPEAERR